jgi:hypothetical protein
MENQFTVEVESSGLGRSRALERAVRRRVRAWAESRLGGAVPRVSIVFERAGVGEVVACRVEVRLGARIHSAVWHGHGPYQALVRCLDHMSSAFTLAVRQPIQIGIG